MLLDTNILLDVALQRQPHYGPSAELLDRLLSQPGRAFVAWHAIGTLYYVASSTLGHARAREFVVFVSGFATVVSTGHTELDYALSLLMRDFEDAMQVAAAQVAGVQHIITRDIRDFTNSPIPAITPEQASQDLF